MKTFSITPDANVTAYARQQTADASGEATFGSAEELGSILTNLQIRPVDLWNSLPGVTPVKKFMNRVTAYQRIWKQLQSLEVAPEQTAPVAPQAARVPREGSKQAQVLDMLRQPGGVALEEIMQATAWQRHTVRGFISAAVSKKLGLAVESFRNEAGERMYRVNA